MFSRVADSRLDWICHFVRGHETVSPRWWPVKVPIPCGSCRFGELWAWADGVMRRSSPVTYSRALLVRERGRRALRYAVEFRTGEQLLDRRILERRAQENGVDFVNGVATAITPMAFYETVTVKGYEALVDSGTKVDVNTGMIAAARLQALIDSRAGKTSMADVLFKMDRIINAVHSTVPKELWPEILRKIEGPVAADTPADEFEDWDNAEDVYDPAESGQADHDCWTQCAGTRQFHRRDQEGVTITEKVHESAHRPIRTFTPPTKTDEDDSF